MSDALTEALAELEKHDQLTLIEKLHDCKRPIWERLLRDVVIVADAWKRAAHNITNDVFSLREEVHQLEATNADLTEQIEGLESDSIEDEKRIVLLTKQVEELKAQQEQIRKIAFEGGGTDHMARRIESLIGEYKIPPTEASEGES